MNIENLGRRITECRMCDSKELYEFLDLGFLPPADGILSKEEMEYPEIFFPLKVAQCQDCGLTQLTYAVNPEILYDEKYSYESSITETGKKHFFEMADSICKKFNFNRGLAVDIGSNVGVLLEGFKRNGLNVLGIDAAPKIVEIANKRGIETWRAFINPEVAKKIILEKGRAKIITGTNVFAHIDDKKGLVESLKILLEDDGVFVFEAPYLVDLIENLEYDTIYLDHLEYLSIKPVAKFFEKNGMEVFDVEKYWIHGNSVRVFVAKKGTRNISDNVIKFINEEKEIYSKNKLDEFSGKVREHREKFRNMLIDLKKQGKKIIGITAPAKGNTILNYCKIDSNIIDYMTEKSKLKPGHYTPGMHIPIVDEEKIVNDKIDYGIIFAWNFAEEIIKNPINQKLKENSTKFIKPIPEPIIMEENGNLFGATIKRINPDFMDERGMIADLSNKQINHVGLITTEVGAQRGPHYHKLSTQDSYILSGRFEVILAPHDNPKNFKKIILNAGEVMSIPPFVIHGFKAIDRAIMIDMSQTRGETGYESDVMRVKIEDMEAK